MRVLVLADVNETGGTGTYFWRLIEYLRERYSVHVALVPGQGSASLAEALRGKGISNSDDFIRFPRLEDGLMRIFRRAKLGLFYYLVRDTLIRRRLERRYRPDFYAISQGGGCRYFGFLKSRKPLLMVMHSAFDAPVSREFAGALYARLFSRRNMANKRICAVSEYSRINFARNIRSSAIAGAAIRIWNFVDVLPGAAPARPRDVVTVLTMGHLIEYKNPALWVEVAKAVAGKYAGRARFVWAGDGSMLDELRQSVGDSENIRFIGYVGDTRLLYSSADIYFQPSLLENHSISVIEAMANSLPCVVSNVGGMTESIEDGKEGFVLSPRDAEGYASSISRLIENEKQRGEMGRMAREKAMRLFSRERWRSEMDTALSDILRADAGRE